MAIKTDWGIQKRHKYGARADTGVRAKYGDRIKYGGIEKVAYKFVKRTNYVRP